MTTPEEKTKLKDKAKKVKDATPNSRFTKMTRWGEVQFESVEQVTDHDGVDFIEVYLAGAEETHWRIYNPPLLVEDPAGPITGNGGRKLREDPIQALAEALALRGGAVQPKGRRL